MNAVVLDAAPALDAAGGAPSGRWRAVLALARIEAVRLLRHPVFIVAVLFLIGIWISGWITNEANHYPVLPDADRETQLGTMLLIGGAALIASNLAVLRPHRHGTTALAEVLVLPYPLRTAAHLLALLPLALFAAALTLARIGVLALAPVAGRPNVFELAAGPVIVLLFGALGVLFGRLTRSPVIAPLAVLALLATLVVFPLLVPSPTSAARWFQPVVPGADSAFALPAPGALLGRPAGGHLVYLVGLAVLVAVAALARSGARTRGVLVSALVGLAVVVAGGMAQAAPVSASVLAARAAAAHHPAAHQTCRQLGQVRYCAFPDFVDWIPAWDAEVRAVLHRVPAAQAQGPFTVRQRIIASTAADGFNATAPVTDWIADDAAAGTPNSVTVGTRWGDSRSAATFAGLFAAQVVTGERPAEDPDVCGARGVVVAWLAGQASAASRTGLRLLIHDQANDVGRGGVWLSEAGSIPFMSDAPSRSSIHLPKRTMTVAMTLLDRPAGDVGALLTRSWDELTSTRTTIERAGEILGVPVPAATQQTADPRDGNVGTGCE